MLDETIITQKANQLLAELRSNPDWAIDEKNFKQGYFKALEWVFTRYKDHRKVILIINTK